MTEYYYTQSLATAAAAIEQGFEECETYDKSLWNMEWQKVFYTLTEYEQWRFPKTPHNVGLMELRAGDLISDGNFSGYFERLDSIPSYADEFDEDGLEKYYDAPCVRTSDDCLWALNYKNYHIIHRNNKPFPVWDKEGV